MYIVCTHLLVFFCQPTMVAVLDCTVMHYYFKIDYRLESINHLDTGFRFNTEVRNTLGTER